MKTVCCIALVAVALLVTTGHFDGSSYTSSNTANAQVTVERLVEHEQSAPTANAKYVGLTKCAACHFKQYEDWKNSPHGKAYEVLPTKYRNDSKCLECHMTGHTEPAMPSSQAAKHKQVGVSCEACHGPGSNHANLALSYIGQEKLLTPDAVETLHAAIKKTALDQCIRCHTAMAHKPHPEFDRTELSRDLRTQPDKKSLLAEIHD
ncbi:MAG: cytochrome c family protein [Planctomycetales bacterium]|nr:cytochrome c family protein [Planctomycetales bacterium]